MTCHLTLIGTFLLAQRFREMTVSQKPEQAHKGAKGCLILQVRKPEIHGGDRITKVVQESKWKWYSQRNL